MRETRTERGAERCEFCRRIRRFIVPRNLSRVTRMIAARFGRSANGCSVLCALSCLAAIVEWCRGVASACLQYITPSIRCPIHYFHNLVAAWGVALQQIITQPRGCSQSARTVKAL